MMEHLPRSQIILVAILVAAGVYVIFSVLDKRRPEKISQKLQRSSNYRTVYFGHNSGLFGRGIYFCPFCGKLMRKKSRIQIDHINAIHRVQKSRFLSERFKRLPDGVNDISNMVHSCPRCNRRKGSKGGIWVFLGRFGQYFMPVVRWAMHGLAVSAVVYAIVRGI